MAEKKRALSFLIYQEYTRAWFQTAVPPQTLPSDVKFLKELPKYYSAVVKQAAASVVHRHLWYLSERLIALTFIHDEVEVG